MATSVGNSTSPHQDVGVTAADPLDQLDTCENQLLTVIEAEKFYKECCAASGCGLNHTFLKQLLSGSSVFAFDNGYLGEHGIVPLIETLRRVCVVELRLPRCGLGYEDLGVICSAFGTHPTLEAIDLRGNSISLVSAKRILALVARNPRITELLLDTATPMYLAIQRQCDRNGNRGSTSALCIVCQQRVDRMCGGPMEYELLALVRNHYNECDNLISPIGIEVLFRGILRCCEENDGVLFLCSSQCCEKVADALYACAQAVVKACYLNISYTLPSLPVMRKFAEDVVSAVRSRNLPQSAFMGTNDDGIRGYSVDTTGTAKAVCEEVCSLCGRKGKPLPNGAAQLMLQLGKDLERLRSVSPSSLLRLCRLIVEHAHVRSCSRRCTRHLVRFCLYGYGGFIRSIPMHGPSLATLDVDLSRLPASDFSLVNFSEARVDSLDDEDITCALTVASAMSDIEGIAIDPYMIFAVGRHLSQLPSGALGMELQAACEAVCLAGCLSASEAPFRRHQGDRPPRDVIGQWENWGKYGDLKRFMHLSFCRRRSAVYIVDGPHRNLFDNTRAALWAFRRQRRCVVVAMKFCLPWLEIADGVIPFNSLPKGGFYTTVKVVGQIVLENTYYVIVQANFGPTAGHHGFFYVPITIFNTCTCGNAYIFVDSMYAHGGVDRALVESSACPISPLVSRLVGSTSRFRDVCQFLRCLTSSNARPMPEDNASFQRLMRSLPPTMFHLFRNDEHSNAVGGSPRDFTNGMLYIQNRLIFQLAFWMSELQGQEVCDWGSFAIDVIQPSLPSFAWFLIQEWMQLVREKEVSCMSRLNHLESRCIIPDTLQWKWVKSPLVSHMTNNDTKYTPFPAHGSKQRAQSRSGRVPTRTPSPANPRSSSRSNRVGASLSRKLPLPAREEATDTRETTSGVSNRTRVEEGWTHDGLSTRGSITSGQLFSHPPVSPQLHGIGFLSNKRRSARNASGNVFLQQPSCYMEAIPHSLIDRPWQAVHLAGDGGVVCGHVGFFIGDWVLIFDFTRQRVLQELMPMKKSWLFARHPFSTGFDCAFNNPANPCEVYFFSAGYWCLWDGYRQECIDGPYSIRLHSGFGNLPSTFHDGVDATIAVPGSTYVLFFAQRSYVVFDMTSRRPIGPLQQLDPCLSAVTCATESTTAAGRSDADGVCASSLGEDAVKLSLPHTLVSLFPHGPMTSLWVRAIQSLAVDENDTNLLLIGDSGNLITVDLHLALQHSDCAAETSTVERSPLVHLPLTFRQTTLTALPLIAESITENEFLRSKGAGLGHVELYEVPSSRMDSHSPPKLGANGEEMAGLGSTVPSGGCASLPHLKRHAPVFRVSTTLAATVLAQSMPTALVKTSPARGIGQMFGSLLQEEVLYYSPVASDKCALPSSAHGNEEPLCFHEIECDCGEGICETFGAIVIAIDRTPLHRDVLRQTPLCVVIESSYDRIAYTRHTTCFIQGVISSASWGETDAKRFWRIRFLSVIPSGVGVVRVLWYRARWREAAGPLRVLAPYNLSATDACEVRITAPQVLRSPKCLLSARCDLPVFGTPGREGWYSKHAILPLMPEGSTSLFFCGDAFVEYDMQRMEPVSARCIRLHEHPAFYGLPYPFCVGFDAIFYPDFATRPSVVALLSEARLVMWNLYEGCRVCDAWAKDAERMFNNFPIAMDSVIDVINDWRCPSEVFVLYRHQRKMNDPWVIRWNVHTYEAATAFVPLHSVPELYHPALDGQQLLCLFSCPSSPSHFYVFCENGVTTAGTDEALVPVRYSQHFYRLCLHLTAWGERRIDVRVVVDFKDDPQVVAGIELRSLEASDSQWLIEYSDNGLAWKNVGVHVQAKRTARTTWLPDSVHHRSHRLWRLTMLPSSVNSEGCNTAAAGLAHLYTHLRFLVPLQRLVQMSPARIAFSGTLNGDTESFLSGHNSITFEHDRATTSWSPLLADSDTRRAMVHHITLDYGDFPADLTGVTCHCNGGVSGIDVWTVLFSDDGVSWGQCGTWKWKSPQVKLSWFAMQPHRYWRVEVQPSEPNLVYSNFHVWENDGPSLILMEDDLSRGGKLVCPNHLLWGSTVKTPSRHCCSGDSVEPPAIRFYATQGNTILLDTKEKPESLVGIALVTVARASAGVAFSIEYSDNMEHWTTLNTLVLYAETRRGTAYWEQCGCHRYWRLRVASASGTDHLLLQNVHVTVAGPSLYRHFVSQRSPKASTNGSCPVAYLRLPEQRSIIRACASLPANSLYAVERLGLDGISWVHAAFLENPEPLNSAVISKAWDRCGKSTSWRMRYYGPSSCQLDGPVPYPPDLHHPVHWYSFAGKKVVPVDINGVRGVSIYSTGFIEVQPISYLCSTDHRGGRAVLRTGETPAETPEWNTTSSHEEDGPAVTWKFESEVRWCQFVLHADLSVRQVDPATAPTGSVLDAADPVKRGISERRGLPKKHVKRTRTKQDSPKDVDAVVVVTTTPPVLTVLVETSDNGIDFMPVTEGLFVAGGMALSWEADVRANYWRVRFHNVPCDTTVQVHWAQWYQSQADPSSRATPSHVSLPNTVYDSLLRDMYGNEDVFVENCRLGFDQAKSLSSRLREKGDTDRRGIIASHVLSMMKKYQGFVNLLSKEASRNKVEVVGPFFAEGRALAHDIMYFLHRTTGQYGGNWRDLISLVAQPLCISKEFCYTKDDSWFYPSFGMQGVLADSFYGFQNVAAAFRVYWSLSAELQRNAGPLLLHSLDIVSPHVASPVVMVCITESNWVAGEHFPDLPILHHVGISGKPITVLYALNEMTFTPKYNLQTPRGPPMPTTFPFRVMSGANFICDMPLTECRAQVFERLKMLYSPQFLDEYCTTLVFTAPSMRSRTGYVRFTLPAAGIDFGLEGLQMECLVFEMHVVEREMSAVDGNSVGARTACSQSLSNAQLSSESTTVKWDYRFSFVSHGAVFCDVKSGTPVEGSPFTFCGAFQGGPDPQIILSGRSPNANWVLPHTPELRLTDITIDAVAFPESHPQSFQPTSAQVHGQILLPDGASYYGSYALRDCGNSVLPTSYTLNVRLSNVHLVEFVRLLQYFYVSTDTDTRADETFPDWVRQLPVRLSCDAVINTKGRLCSATGTLHTYDENATDAYISMSEGSLGITASLHRICIGNLQLCCLPEEEAVLVTITARVYVSDAPAAEGVGKAAVRPSCASVRFEGATRSFFSTLCPVTVELSASGTTCYYTNCFCDILFSGDSYNPVSWRSDVQLRDDIIVKHVAECISGIPIIVALRAAGMPFVFTPHEVIAEASQVTMGRLLIVMRGLLYGNWFDVTAITTETECGMGTLVQLARELALQIVERCQVTLWESYAAVVGCARISDTPQVTGANSDSGANSVLAHHFTTARGQFLGRWAEKECVYFDRDVNQLL